MPINPQNEQKLPIENKLEPVPNADSEDNAETIDPAILEYKLAEADVAEADVDEDPSFTDVLQASLRTYNMTVAGVVTLKNAASNLMAQPDPNFDRERAVTSIPENEREFYASANSQEEFDNITLSLIREKEDRKTLEKAGFMQSLIGGGIAMALDPSMWISAGIARGVGIASKTGKFLKAAVEGGTFGVAYGSLDYATHKLKRATDIISDAAAFGVINVAFAGLKNIASPIFNKLKEKAKQLLKPDTQYRYEVSLGKNKQIQSEVTWKETYRDDPNNPGEKILVSVEKVSSDRIFPGKMHKLLEKQYRLSVIGQCATSEFEAINKLGQVFSRSSYVSANNLAGIPTPPSAETLHALSHIDLINFKYAQESFMKKFLDTNIARQYKLKSENFFDLTWEYIMNGRYKVEKMLPTNSPEIVQIIEDSANSFWKFGQNLLDEAFQYDILKKQYNIKNALDRKFLERKAGEDLEYVEEKYLTRIYNKDAIARDSENFKKLLTTANKIVYDEQDIFVEKIAEEQYLKIMGSDFINQDYLIPDLDATARVSIEKERSVMLSSNELKKYLITNPVIIGEVLHKKLSANIAINKALKEHGVRSLESIKDNLEAEYKTKLADFKHIPPNKIEQESIALNTKYKKALQLIEDMPLILKGKYDSKSLLNNPSLKKVLTATTNYNYSRLLGAVTLSSLDDLAMIIKDWGIKEFCGEFAARIDSLVSKDKRKILKLSREDLKACGVACQHTAERIMSRVNDQIYDPISYEMGGGLNRLVRATERMGKVQNTLSFINIWTDFMKSIDGTIYLNKVTSILKKDVLSHEDKVWLAKKTNIPINKKINGKPVWKIVKEQLEKHGEEYDGYLAPNLERWDNKQAREYFAASVNTHSHNTIIEPSKFDLPRALKTPLGRFALQFQTYLYSLYNNHIMRISSGDWTGVGGFVITSTVLGAVSKYLKSFASDDPYENLLDKRLWEEALKDNPILTPLGTYAVKFVDLMQASVKGGGRKAFLDSLSKQSTGLGYIVSAIDNAIYPFSKEFKKPISQYRMESIIKLLPYTNIPYFNYLIKRGVKNYVQTHGGKLKKTKHQKFLLENKQ
ncbi:MAG: hypothetical protein LBJ80_00130 [Rickettsiales bacterium]|jgi:hypothetical protein|nr:hypothetical protein [Rickettsiales bacterium]